MCIAEYIGQVDKHVVHYRTLLLSTRLIWVMFKHLSFYRIMVEDIRTHDETGSVTRTTVNTLQ